MKLLSVDSLDEARGKLLRCVKGWKPAAVRAPVLEACGRILAVDVAAECDIPAFRRSMVDGYAVVDKDTAGAGDSSPVFLSVKETVRMGFPAAGTINAGECAYVPTGGMVPEGANAMVMVEYSEPFGEDGVVIYKAAAFGQHVAQVGEDAQNGGVLLRRGARVRPQEVGALAAAGVSEVDVYAPLRLIIISTGDELVPPSAAPAPGQVRDINTLALHALALQSGYRVVATRVLPDDAKLLEQTIKEAMAGSDVVVVSGGSSQGEKDFTRDVIARVSSPGVLTHGMAVKPGKPTILGYDDATETVLVGLPGHPVSAMMVFESLLGWLVTKLTGGARPCPVPARINCAVAASPGKTTVQPVELIWDGEAYHAEPVFGKSGMMATMTRADGYVVIGMDSEGLNKGDAVLVHLWT